MKKYKPDHEDVVTALTETIEKETGNKIFTVIVHKDDPDKEYIEMYVVFTSKDVLELRVIALTTGETVALRIQGNYI